MNTNNFTESLNGAFIMFKGNEILFKYCYIYLIYIFSYIYFIEQLLLTI